MSKSVLRTIDACRICGSAELTSVIDLGEQYIATHFVTSEVPDFLTRRYPLELVRCASLTGCGLVQLRHTVHPSALYFDYGYRSGINQTMRSNLADLAVEIEDYVGVKKGDTVLDIGCNDGTLLGSYRTSGLDKIGIDPSENVVALAREKGLEVITDYFSAKAYVRARPHKKAKVVTSIAMFYDLERPSDFVGDVASIMTDDGVWIIELSYLPFMLRNNSYDSICHEHLEYYSLKPLEWMLGKAGLGVDKVEFNDINGGSFRVFIRKLPIGKPDDATALERVRESERSLGLDSDLPFMSFRQNVSRVRHDLRRLLADVQGGGEVVYVYGASTKGNTILQFCGVDEHLVPKAADRNPFKWGRRPLGTNIEVISEEQARAERPDYFLILAWHYLEEFKKREAAFFSRRGKFIVPLPEVRVIGQENL